MGSKERIEREKKEIREKILRVSLDIIIKEGCFALSMRKIADRIEYAASTIYEYFDNKDAILTALITKGYEALSKELKKIKKKKLEPRQELLAMWECYWNFALENSELYKLMFSIQISCPKPIGVIHNIREPQNLFVATILQTNTFCSEGEAALSYTGMWSLVHGLISLNMAVQPIEKEINSQILSKSINALIK